MTDETFPLEKTDDEWQQELSPTQYQVLPRPGSQLNFTEVGLRTSELRSSGGVKVQSSVLKLV